VEVWLNGNPDYLEVEAVGPVEPLGARGGSTTFTADWYATRLEGPVLAFNGAGSVIENLAVQGGRSTGRFGMLHKGLAKLPFADENGVALAQGTEHTVTPLETLTLDETDTLPPGTVSVSLMFFAPTDLVRLSLKGGTKSSKMGVVR
jgi:hypothetical protein